MLARIVILYHAKHPKVDPIPLRSVVADSLETDFEAWLLMSFGGLKVVA